MAYCTQSVLFPLPMTNPKVSVLLPVYNAERFLALAIESILSQTFQDFELIVIDDCSRDGSWRVVEEYAGKDARIVAVKNEKNLNLSATLNKGIAMAKGEYIVRMDHDDISLPFRLEKQVQFLDEHPDVGIVGGDIEIIDEEGMVFGQRKYNRTDQTIREKIFWYSPFCHPAVAIRKKILDEVGNYDHRFSPADDYELYFRVGMKSKFANLDATVLKYRIVRRTSMTTGGTRKMEKLTIAVRRKYADFPPYRMGFADRLYNLVHYLSLYLVPTKFKSWCFAKLRNS